MSDGKTYLVTNHDMAWVTGQSIYIGVSVNSEEIVERYVQCAILHVTRIEENIPSTTNAA
jgi:hypothetical protein